MVALHGLGTLVGVRRDISTVAPVWTIAVQIVDVCSFCEKFRELEAALVWVEAQKERVNT